MGFGKGGFQCGEAWCRVRAAGALEDDLALTIEDTSTDEERFKTLGTDFLGRIVVVVYTYRGERIRIISAKKATARQRAMYEGKQR